MVAAPTLCNSLPKELRAIITDVNSVLRRILRLIFLELYIGDEFYFILLRCIYILLFIYSFFYFILSLSVSCSFFCRKIQGLFKGFQGPYLLFLTQVPNKL